MKIFVNELSSNTTNEDLRNAFEKYGKVSSVEIIKDSYTGKSKGFGFIEMPFDDEGYHAISDLDGFELDGRTILVKKAKPISERNNDRRGGGSIYNRGNGSSRNRGGGSGRNRDGDSRRY